MINDSLNVHWSPCVFKNAITNFLIRVFFSIHWGKLLSPESSLFEHDAFARKLFSIIIPKCREQLSPLFALQRWVNSIPMESIIISVAWDVNLESKKKENNIPRVLYAIFIFRIFMKEGATRANFSIRLQLARWQTTLETLLGPFCISNDPVGSIVALMLLRKTFRFAYNREEEEVLQRRRR